jgi:hypothetical protein
MLYCAHHVPSARTALVDRNKAANVMAGKIMPMDVLETLLCP